MAKQENPLEGKVLVKEVCRRIRVARSYWDAHNDAACRGERDRALALYNTLTPEQKEEVRRDRLQLTYGFCSSDLKRFLHQKDPMTGLKNERVDPSRDQHMAHEKNRNGKYAIAWVLLVIFEL